MIKINNDTKEVFPCDMGCENPIYIEGNYLDYIEMLKPMYDESNQSISEGDISGVLEIKKSILREIRNSILFQTVTAIQQQYRCEKDDAILNGNTSGKITDEVYKNWLEYWRELRDLPETYDFETHTKQEIREQKDFPILNLEE